jgi:uncharacterized protein YndB with AHSA1/START domain
MVRVTRTFPARRARVFRAFVEAEAIEIWFAGPSRLRWTEPPQLDVRPGGRYRFTVTDGDKLWCIYGTYREVAAPERLVFTWEWDRDPSDGSSGRTLVTVELQERGDETEVVLTHEDLPSEQSRRDHAQGWEECLDLVGAIAAS